VAAARIAEALKAAGIEVWFDKNELRGGEAWDRRIHNQIHDCRLFIAVISSNTEARDEGYFRREWRLAVDRTLDMAENKAFLVPVVIDGTSERSAAVPEAFHRVQWTRLPGNDSPASFVSQVARLMGADPGAATTAGTGPTPAVPPPPAPRHHHRRLSLGVLALLAVAAGGWIAWRNHWMPGSASDVGVGETSIAVLPFTDMSEQHDQQYFGDGLAEEILNVLGTIPGWKVIGRSSSFQFRDHTQDLRKVGEILGARYIVEGSVRKAGKQLNVTAQLVDATDGTTRWSDNYQPSPADALSLQRQIATAVAHALRMTVLGYFSGGGTRSEEAHDLYLRGIRDTDSGEPDAMQRAITELTRAVEIDPKYVEGWVGLANAYDNVATEGLAPRAENYRLALQAIDKALALNPTSADAYSMRAFVRMNGYDWSGAEEDIRRSLQLHRSVNGIEAASKLAIARGKLGEADDLLKEVLATDPLDVYALSMQAYPLYPAMGRFKEADRICDKLRDIDAAVPGLNADQAAIALWQGDHERALRMAEAEPDATTKLALLVIIYTATGKTELSKQTFAQYLRNPPDSDYYLASMYAIVGDRDRAFEHLDRLYERRAPDLLLLRVEPLFANLRGDPRYKALLRRLKLPE